MAGRHSCPRALPLAQQEKTLRKNSNQEPVRSVAHWTEILFIVTCHLPWQTEPSTAAQRVQEKRQMFPLKQILAQTAELENPEQEKNQPAYQHLPFILVGAEFSYWQAEKEREHLFFKSGLAQQPRKDKGFVPAQS